MILNNNVKREANDNKFINIAFFTLKPLQNSCYTSACYYCIRLHFCPPFASILIIKPGEGNVLVLPDII
jgi:hypothetical protein